MSTSMNHLNPLAAHGTALWAETFVPRPNAKLRLLCFAHAGGGASAFSTWHRELPAEIEICGVQLPGRESRRKEGFATRIDVVTEQLLQALKPLHDRPVALFGYSLGGLLAYEYARGLRRRGRPAPTQLVIGAARAPHRPADAAVHELAQADFVQEVGERYDGIPRQIAEDPELLAYFLPVIRADLALLSSYPAQKHEPLDCPITAFGGETDPRITPDEIQHWRELTSSSFNHRIFAGGHFFIASERKLVLDAVTTTILGGTA